MTEGPVGGAGELTALSEGEIRTIIYDALKNQFPAEGAAIMVAGCCAKPVLDALNKALAAKASQGVPPVEAEAVNSTKGNNLVGFNVKVFGVDFGFHGSETPLGRVLAASKLPVPPPVSDDTIHHGMVPPATVFKTTVLGVGPWCVEFPDGEIISTRSEARARLIAEREAAAPKPAPPSDEQVRKEFYDREYQAQEMATPAPGAETALPQPVCPTCSGVGTIPPSERLLKDLTEKVSAYLADRGFGVSGATARQVVSLVTVDMREALAAAPPAPQPIETLVHQLTKVTMELEDTLASLGKADSMITKLKDLIAERDLHASAERQDEIILALRDGQLHLQEQLRASAERVRQIAAQWREQAQSLRVSATGYALGELASIVLNIEASRFDGCADELERALPPSTGEKP